MPVLERATACRTQALQADSGVSETKRQTREGTPARAGRTAGRDALGAVATTTRATRVLGRQFACRVLSYAERALGGPHQSYLTRAAGQRVRELRRKS